MKRKKESPEVIESIILNICYKIYPIVFALWAITAVIRIFVEVI